MHRDQHAAVFDRALLFWYCANSWVDPYEAKTQQSRRGDAIGCWRDQTDGASTSADGADHAGQPLLVTERLVLGSGLTGRERMASFHRALDCQTRPSAPDRGILTQTGGRRRRKVVLSGPCGIIPRKGSNRTSVALGEMAE
jgi:hypothetical protein